MDSQQPIKTPWLDRCFPIGKYAISTEKILFLIILLLALITRFYNLGERALSHDESIHLYYSYLFSQGQGYSHTPLSHGPFQFHVIGLLFFLFESSDFLGRVPQAISSVLTVLLLWKWRKYLGRSGTIIASLLMVISPFMLYYGRYARNESFVILFGLLTLFSVLRYLETKKTQYLVMYTAATALHFTSKETAFIYTAQLLIFLFILILHHLRRTTWKIEHFKRWFFAFIIIILILIFLFILEQNTYISAIVSLSTMDNGGYLLIFMALSSFIALLLFTVGFGWNKISEHPAFDLIVLTGTFILPQLTAFPVSWLGWNPMDYKFTWPGWNPKAIFAQTPPKTGIIFIILFIISVIVGVSWGKKKWLLYGIIFWGIYSLFFTSFFTNPLGFFTGSIGSLGYWLEQQSVHRGNQPFYYYLLVQIPLYEFLPLIGLVPAIYFGARNKIFPSLATPIEQVVTQSKKSQLFFFLLIWWVFSSVLAFSMAGEKMPWLTVHICFPMILLTGWGLGKIINNIHLGEMAKSRRYITYIAVLLITVSLIGIISSSLGINPSLQEVPSKPQDLTSRFIYWILVCIIIIGWLIITGTRWYSINNLLIVSFFLLMGIFTARTSFTAAFINPGNAYEYLVYAHGTDGIKTSITTISQISHRVSGGFNKLSIAYDAGGETQGTSWPMKWYMRNFSDSFAFYSVDSSLSLADVIIADPQSFDEIDQLLSQKYNKLDTLRIVWPNQDYFDLSEIDLFHTLEEARGRNALFQIWYDKNYSLYADYYGREIMSFNNWFPSDQMRVYIKKEIANQLWEYNIVP
jgi:uncharacterized protein (TIGR03663 family)